MDDALYIGHRRGFPRTIAGVSLDLAAGNAALQAAIAANAAQGDLHEERRLRAMAVMRAAWSYIDLPERQVRVRWDRSVPRTWCEVWTDDRGAREVWSRKSADVATLEVLAAWWSQQEVIP